MTTSKIYSIIVLILLLSAGELMSQVGGGAMPYHRMGSNPRIMGIGNAYVAGSHLGIYAQYNPALASKTSFNQIDLSGAILSYNRNLASASATFPLPPNAGLQITATYAGVSNFDGRTPSGYHTETFSTHDLQASATFGLQLNPKMAIGLTARFLTARYNPDVPAPTSFGADIGFRYILTDHTAIGFSVQDLLSEFTWDTQELYNTPGSIQQKDALPTRLKFGLQHLMPDQQLALFLEFEHRIQSSQTYILSNIIENGRPLNRITSSTESFSSNYFRIGANWTAHERIDLRAGWQSGDLEFIGISQRFSGGFTLKLPFDLYRPEIDYVFMREPQGVSWLHMFAIRLHINE